MFNTNFNIKCTKRRSQLCSPLRKGNLTTVKTIVHNIFITEICKSLLIMSALRDYQ